MLSCQDLLSVYHIVNKIPSKRFKVSPYELWKGRKLIIGYFKVWGYLAYSKNTDLKRTKLIPRGIKCDFVGYAQNSNAYRLLILETNVIIESHEVDFFENILSSDNDSLRETQVEIPSFARSQIETPSDDVETNELRRSKRAQKEKVLGPDEIDIQLISFHLVEENEKSVTRTTPYVLQVEINPKTYQESILSRDRIFWKDAVNNEISSIMSNNT